MAAHEFKVCRDWIKGPEGSWWVACCSGKVGAAASGTGCGGEPVISGRTPSGIFG